MPRQVYIFKDNNALKKPKTVRGEMVNSSLIILMASSQEEANKKHDAYYKEGVRVGFYNPK